MKRVHGLVLLVALGGAATARAQVPIFPFGPGYPFGGVRFAYRGHHLALSGFWGRSVYGFGYPWTPYFGFPGYGFRSTNVTIIQSPPPFAYAPPIIINNQPIVIVPERRDPVEEEEFLRIEPRKRALANNIPKKEPVPKKEKKLAQIPRVPSPEPPPRRVAPPELPKGRSDRLLAFGKLAFGFQEYGRAERFFLQATEVPPVDPLAYFDLAQAQFARAEYQEAVASIHAGLRILPDWPRSHFRAEEFYGPNAGDFKDHLKRLEETLARHPHDPHLLFLHAYELWFTGRPEEARAQFQHAAKVTADKTFIEMFLRVKAPVPVAGVSQNVNP
jgi:tetratricopeptide (TPR) repeat protein